MNRGEILETAKRYVTKDRNDQYGSPEDSFNLIATLWDAYIDAKPHLHPIDAYDVAVMMALLKIARMTKRPNSPDSAIDLAGYAACAGEILTKKQSFAYPSNSKPAE